MASTRFRNPNAKTSSHLNAHPVSTGAAVHRRTALADAILSSFSMRASWAGVAACVLASVASPTNAADCSWSAANAGSWTASEFWSGCATGFPNAPTDNALIDATGQDYTVTLDTNIEVDTLTLDSSNATVIQSAGALSFNLLSIQRGTYALTGGALVGGTVQQTGANGLRFDGNFNELDGVTVRGELNVEDDIGSTSYVAIRNGLTVLSEDGTSPGTVNVGRAGFGVIGFVGDQTFDHGTINLGGVGASGFLAVEGDGLGVDATDLILGPDALVQGAGNIAGAYYRGGLPGTLKNEGAIRSNLAGQVLNISGIQFTNDGLVEAVDGGVLTIDATEWTNNGTLSIDATSTMGLGGVFTPGALGTVLNAGTWNLYGTLVNTGQAFTLSSATRSLNLTNGKIIGGTVQQTGANGLRFDGGFNELDGVTVRGELNVEDDIGSTSYVAIRNGLTVLSEDGTSPGTVNVGRAGFGAIGFVGDQTFDHGTINLGGVGASGFLAVEGDGFGVDATDLVLGPDALVQGAGNITGAYYRAGLPGTLTNQGVIRANVAGQALVNGVQLTNLSNGILTGGSWEADENAILRLSTAAEAPIHTNSATLTLSGLDSRIDVLDAQTGFAVTLESSLNRNTAAGTLNLLASRDFANVQNFDNAGTIRLGGGNFDTASLQNQATGVITGFGSIVPRIANAGTVRAAEGTLVSEAGIDGNTGRVRTAGGGVLQIGADSQAGVLDNQGALNLGAFNFVVSKDYDNASFGTGNSFNRRANVTGAGQILAAGDTAQGLTGDVTGGSTAAPTLALGNIHVGDTLTKTYRVANLGTTGPDLRGAIQTNVNGGQITDSRLTGAGVTAGNYGPVATQGNSAAMDVVFSGLTAGALTGQRVAVVNNFDNLAGQVLTLSGAVYRLAAANSLADIELGNVHVGDIVSRSLSITNIAANDGFSEKLNATFGAVSDARIFAAGSISQLAAQATDSTSLTIGLDTSTAGSVNGFATVDFVSDGAGTSDLGLTNLPSQNVGVRTNVAVYRFADAQITSTQPIDFGAFRVGDSVSSIDLAIKNDVADDGFSEKLNASAGTADDGFSATGAFNLLGAGATNTGGIKVGVDTSVAGVKTGTARVNLESDGDGTSNLGRTALGQQSVDLKAKVYAEAVADVQTAGIDFGIVHVGDTVTERAIAVQNDATGALTDTLRGNVVAVPAGFTASGSLGVAGIAAGFTSIELTIGLDTATAGVFTGNASLGFASHNADMADLSLLSRQVSLTAQVNNFANPVLTKAGGDGSLNGVGPSLLFDFGLLTAGADGVIGTLELTNLVSGPADELGAHFSVGLGSFALSGFDDFTSLAAGAARSLSVRFDPLTAGLFEQTVHIDLFGENGSGFHGGLGTLDLTFRAEVAPVPVPGAVWLMGSGIALLCARRRATTAPAFKR